MSGAGPVVPSLDDLRVLLDAARLTGGPPCAVLELSISTLLLPWEICAMDVADVVPERAAVLVGLRRRRTPEGRLKSSCHHRLVPLSAAGLAAVRRIAGSARRSGPVVTDGEGGPYVAQHARPDRIMETLAKREPASIHVKDWNFHGIRAAAIDSLVRADVPRQHVAALLGHQPRERTKFPADPLKAGRIAIDTWSRILTGRGSPDGESEREG